MFIQTQSTSDPDVIEFLPGKVVYPQGPLAFTSPGDAQRSPLAKRLFEIEEVRAVTLGAEAIAVTKAPNAQWVTLKPHVLAAVMQHFTSGQPVLRETAPEGLGEDGQEVDPATFELESDAPPEVIEQVKELIDTRIHPAIAQTGGDVAFHSLVGGTLNLKITGSAFGMLQQMERLIRHYAPEVDKVQDYRDAIPKPGLQTPVGQAVKQVLDTRINPAVAGHGGHISLIDVRDTRVFLRLEGGCQGCGMAAVTLRQGVEQEIRRAVPEVSEILDVTDHAAGSNPYYQPGSGASAMA